jgi:putative NADH-flavin reductase
MRIALFGATGMIGSRILDEALQRGHEVTAIIRDPAKLQQTNPKLNAVAGDVLDPASVTALVAGHDVVISAYSPGIANTQGSVAQAAKSLIAGVTAAKVRRLLAIGGAGCLEVKPGVDLIDSGMLPEAWKAIAIDHRNALKIYQSDGGPLDWTVLCPAAYIEPGVRTGKFRLGSQQLVMDARNESRISAEDYAVALLDEVDKPAHIRQFFTLAY